jgi:pimeloyl-ACP methyl ester carboxylesterase
MACLGILAALGSIVSFAAAPLAAAEPGAGVVFVVDGIGGFEPLGFNARLLLPRSGVVHEIREFRWGHGKGKFLRDLQDTAHLLVKADELALQVLDVKRRAPARPVFLVGYSAGTFIVLEAARKLPPATLERVVLLSSAVSPTYDLRPALRATRGEIVSYNSSLERLILDWGTSQFGTADRVFGPAAGLHGFEPPRDLDAEGAALYRRLVQRPWQPRMLLEGRGGLHSSTHAPIFVARELAAWLRDR